MLVAALWTILHTHSNRLDLRVLRAALRAKFTRVCFSQLIRLYIFNIVCCVFAANLRWLGVVQFFTLLGFTPLLGFGARICILDGFLLLVTGYLVAFRAALLAKCARFCFIFCFVYLSSTLSCSCCIAGVIAGT